MYQTFKYNANTLFKIYFIISYDLNYTYIKLIIYYMCYIIKIIRNNYCYSKTFELLDSNINV